MALCLVLALASLGLIVQSASAGGKLFGRWDIAGDPTTGLFSARPALGDLDGDGDLDFIAGSEHVEAGITPTSFYCYENIGSASSPSFASRTFVSNPFYLINVGLSLPSPATSTAMVISI